jgi:hypothetical protein
MSCCTPAGRYRLCFLLCRPAAYDALTCGKPVLFERNRFALFLALQARGIRRSYMRQTSTLSKEPSRLVQLLYADCSGYMV